MALGGWRLPILGLRDTSSFQAKFICSISRSREPCRSRLFGASGLFSLLWGEGGSFKRHGGDEGPHGTLKPGAPVQLPVGTPLLPLLLPLLLAGLLLPAPSSPHSLFLLLPYVTGHLTPIMPFFWHRVCLVISSQLTQFPQPQTLQIGPLDLFAPMPDGEPGGGFANRPCGEREGGEQPGPGTSEFNTHQPQPQGLMPGSHVWQCPHDRVTTDTSPFLLPGVGPEGKGVHFSLSSRREVFQKSFPQVVPHPTIKGHQFP